MILAVIVSTISNTLAYKSSSDASAIGFSTAIEAI